LPTFTPDAAQSARQITPDTAENPRHIAVFIFGLSGGGAQRRTVTLANAFAARGHRVDLVLVKPEGPLAPEVSEAVGIVPLTEWGAPSLSAHLPRRVGLVLAARALTRYLNGARPDVLLSAASHVHLPALHAHRKAGAPCRIVLRVSNHLSRQGTRTITPTLARRFYPRADAFIAVSQSVADDLIGAIALPRQRVTAIYNPVVTRELLARAEEPLDHPWFAAGEPPVVLGVGRLVKQKDFPTLVRAFARVRERRPARLLLLGETKKPRRRRRLEELIRELGVDEDVAIEGFVDNPLPYMRGAAVFALSSAWEGLPGALIEAMACGCPPVSTDCPGGSAEILDQGRLGPLVPVGDDAALAEAIVQQLECPTAPALLEARAREFALDLAVDHYLEVLLQR
jgi:glycosyltransferase involved in cell wall biosynthesis